MKKLIFYLVGAIFLFASCQSDLLENDDAFLNEALKSPNAKPVTKEMTIMSYEGFIVISPIFNPTPDDCNIVLPGEDFPLYFEQTGSGVASHIGQYTFVNTACLGLDGLEEFEGVITASNGDEIHYGLDKIECVNNPSSNFCPYEPATFTYLIDGGTGRFEEASGTLIINGLFVPDGKFEATGYAEITY